MKLGRFFVIIQNAIEERSYADLAVVIPVVLFWGGIAFWIWWSVRREN